MGNLGEDKTEVRLVGIYALQRVMQDSRRDHPTIANVLATYIRTHAAKPRRRARTSRPTSRPLSRSWSPATSPGTGPFPPDFRGVKLPGIPLDFFI